MNKKYLRYWFYL